MSKSEVLGKPKLMNSSIRKPRNKWSSWLEWV